MGIIKPVKTPGLVVLAHQLVEHPGTVVGSSIATLTEKAVVISMYHANTEVGVDDVNPGMFMVQIRPDAGGGSINEHWITFAEYQVKGTQADDEVMTEIEPAGEKILAVAATASFVAGDLLYIEDIDILVDSEWAECQKFVVNTSINLFDGLTNEKSTAGSGCRIFNDADKFYCLLPLNAIESYRVIWSHEGNTGADGHVLAIASTHKEDTSTE